MLGLSLRPFVSGAAPLILVALGLFVILLAETCRIPVDDPNTHLELTMIHEAMVLDHGGPLLGTILYASSMKLFVLGSVLLGVIAPFRTGTPLLDWPLFVGEMLALAVGIGVARVRDGAPARCAACPTCW